MLKQITSTSFHAFAEVLENLFQKCPEDDEEDVAVFVSMGIPRLRSGFNPVHVSVFQHTLEVSLQLQYRRYSLTSVCLNKQDSVVMI
jgi:hypothetical protein